MKLLVTGATGFVGRPLCAELLRQGHSVRAATRTTDARIDGAEMATVENIDDYTL